MGAARRTPLMTFVFMVAASATACPGFQGHPLDDAGDEHMPLVPTCGTAFGPCNPVDGSGCDGGLACYIDPSGTTASCQTPGAALPGDTCAVHADCAPGMVCDGLQCEKLCCPGQAALCAQGPGRNPASVCFDRTMALSRCSIPCDWRTGVGCSLAHAETCEPINTAGDGHCFGAGRQGQRQMCSLTDPGLLCAAGYFCVNAPPMPACARICATDPDADAGCATGEQCAAFGLGNEPSDFGGCQ